MITKEKFFTIFTVVLSFISIAFLICLFFNGGGYLDNMVFNGFKDYFADFFNHAKLTYSENIYTEPNLFPERGLSPVEYNIFNVISAIADYKVVYTKIINGISLPPDFSKAVYFANYCHCTVCVLFFIYLFENLKTEKQFLKYLIIFSFLVSAPFIYYFERGNTIILSVFAVSFFIFNFESENKIKKELSLAALSFACALKFVPCIFTVLLLFKKRYKDVLKVIVYTVFIMLFSFLTLNGGLSNIPYFIKNALFNCKVYGYGSNWLLDIQILIPLIFMPVFKSDWKRFCILVMLAGMFNNFTGYRMLYFLPVTIMFLNQREFNKSDFFYGAALILILCPIKYAALYGVLLLNLAFISEILKYIYDSVKTKLIKQS